MRKKRENVSLNQSFNDDYNYSKKINYDLYRKYSKNDFSYSKICINNLITHQTCRIVARFTDFLIFDDNTEFLHEFCPRKELYSRLQYIFNFYTSYSKIYPNYLIIPENKFLYKNLRKKQKIIDEENALKFCTPKNKKSTKEHNINNNCIRNSKNNNLNTTNKNDDADDAVFFNKNIIESINRQILSPNNKNAYNNNSSSKKKCNKISYSHELNFIISSISSESRNSCYNNNNINMPKNSFNSISSKKKLKLDLEEMDAMMLLKNHLLNVKNYNNNDDYDITFGTQNSSNLNNNFYSETQRSKKSLTEIINLINGKKNKIVCNKIKNGSSDKIDKKKVYNIKKTIKHKFNFLMLDFGIIKKNIKSNKSKLYSYNNVKTEKNKTPLNIKEAKEEVKYIKKKDFLKNYPQKKYSNDINKNKNNIYHKQAVSCLEDISKILKNKKKADKRQKQLKNLSKLNKNKKNSRSNEQNINNLLCIQTMTCIGKVINKRHERNENRNNKNYSRKSDNSKTKKSLNFVNNISTNSTLNFGNSYYKSYKANNNNNAKLITDIHNSNENKNCNKYKNNHRIMKSIETLINIGGEERKAKLHNFGEFKKVFKLETDSLQSTQVSLNRKPHQKSSQKFTYYDKILTQIKRTIKTLNKSKNENNNTALSSFSKKYNTEQNILTDNKIRDKISSYGSKPFTENYQKNLYFAKIKLKKQRTSTLIKNNKMINYFTSKDFYNLKINNNNINIAKSHNKSIIKKNSENNHGKIDIKRSINKNMENNKDINANEIDSSSFILKTFNKDNCYTNKNNISNINNKKNNKKIIINKTSKFHRFNFKNIDFEKIKKNYRRYLYNNIYKCISYDKTENTSNFNRTHKKNNTTNICKNIEEIIKKKSSINHKRNQIIILNSVIKKNKNFQIKFKTPFKTIIKSLELNKNQNNNTNCKDERFTFVGKFVNNNNKSNQRMRKMI